MKDEVVAYCDNCERPIHDTPVYDDHNMFCSQSCENIFYRGHMHDEDTLKLITETWGVKPDEI